MWYTSCAKIFMLLSCHIMSFFSFSIGLYMQDCYTHNCCCPFCAWNWYMILLHSLAEVSSALVWVHQSCYSESSHLDSSETSRDMSKRCLIFLLSFGFSLFGVAIHIHILILAQLLRWMLFFWCYPTMLYAGKVGFLPSNQTQACSGER